MRPVVLTLWDDFEAIEGHAIYESISSMPVVIAVRVRVSSNNYLTLSTQPSSIVYVAPDVSEASRLGDW